MADLPLISVGIPTFNRPEGLRHTLSRITQQTYSNLEIIISDNQSDAAEAVKAVVDSFAVTDKRIRFTRQSQNLGSVGNFHFLVNQASGDYFLWAADDDEVELDYIATLFSALSKHPKASVAMTGYDVTDTMSQPPIFTNLTKPMYSLCGATPFERLRNYIAQPDHLGKSRLAWGMFRRPSIVKAFADCIAAYRGAPPLIWPDLPIEVRVLAQGDLVIDPKVLFHVALLPTSQGKKDMAQRIAKMMEIARRCSDSLRAVVADADLTESERSTLMEMLKAKYRKDRFQLFVYYGVISKVPWLARWVKKLLYALN